MITIIKTRTKTHRVWLLLILLFTTKAGLPQPVIYTEQNKHTFRPEFIAPLALTPQEKMPSFPLPGEFVAFSLKVASETLEQISQSNNWRSDYTEIYNLGGINKIDGAVYDRNNEDLIIVGKHDPDKQPLTLDDLVVALRARFVYCEWPLVSIDPPIKGTQNEKKGLQIVRFEGGIQDTQFGADLLDADYRMKLFNFDLLKTGVSGFPNIWNIEIEDAEKKSHSYNITTRFWLYPSLNQIIVRNDVVFLPSLRVAAFSEILSVSMDGKPIENLNSVVNRSAEIFVNALNTKYDELAGIHPSFSRVQGLMELTALSRAIENLDVHPKIDFWIYNYDLKRIKLPRYLNLVKRKESMSAFKFSAEGGVRFSAIATRLKAGDVSALHDAVISSRTDQRQLAWRFIVGQWIIPLSKVNLDPISFNELYLEAIHFFETKHYDEAIILCNKLIDQDSNRMEYQLSPLLSEIYYLRGTSYLEKKMYEEAISDYTESLNQNLENYASFHNRAICYSELRQFDKARQDIQRSIEIYPNSVEALVTKAAIYYEWYGNTGNNTYWSIGQESLNKASNINPEYFGIHLNKGLIKAADQDLANAIKDFNKAIQLNPACTRAYSGRGLARVLLGWTEDGLDDLNTSIGLDPGFVEGYVCKASAFIHISNYEQAIESANVALRLDPNSGEAYVQRGVAHSFLGNKKQAIKDLTSAYQLGFKKAKDILELIK